MVGCLKMPSNLSIVVSGPWIELQRGTLRGWMGRVPASPWAHDGPVLSTVRHHDAAGHEVIDCVGWGISGSPNR